MHPDVFDFEIGVPVPAPIKAAGRVNSGRLPAAKVARTVFHGAYEGWCVNQGPVGVTP